MKTINKKARQNVRQYILDHFEPCGYDFTGREDKDYRYYRYKG